MIALYVAWMALGVITFGRMAHFNLPWWMYLLVIAWGFTGGAWAHLTFDAPRRRREHQR